MAATSRFTGAGRLKSMREDMACCLMKLLTYAPFELALKSIENSNIPQYTRVRGQPSNRNANMIIYSVHLLLVRRKLAK